MCVSFVERWTFEERDREKERPGARIEESTEYLCVCVCVLSSTVLRESGQQTIPPAAPMKSSFLNFLERAPSPPPPPALSSTPYSLRRLPWSQRCTRALFNINWSPTLSLPDQVPDPPAAATSAYASPPLTLLSFVKSS